MAALDFAAIETTLLAWLVAVTGVPTERVILDLDQTSQPGAPYITLRIPEPQQVGGPDDFVYSDTPGSPAGAEVTTTIVGHREMTVSIKAFTFGRTGAGTAKQLLSQAQTSLALPKYRDAFNLAGLAFVSIELLQDLSSRDGPVGQGRAVMDIRFRCADEATQTDTYIETVTGEGTAAAP